MPIDSDSEVKDLKQSELERVLLGIGLSLWSKKITMPILKNRLHDCVVSVRKECYARQECKEYLKYTSLKTARYHIVGLLSRGTLSSAEYDHKHDIMLIDISMMLHNEMHKLCPAWLEDKDDRDCRSLRNAVIHEEAHRVDYLMNELDVDNLSDAALHGPEWWKIYCALGGTPQEIRLPGSDPVPTYGPRSRRWAELEKELGRKISV